MLSHTYRSCQPDDSENSMCFEILGFDIFLDHKLKPWIIEVNHTPSFSTDSPLDFEIKRNVIHDTLKLINLCYYKKDKYKREKHAEFQKRAIKGNKAKITREMKDEIRNKKDVNRNKIEARIAPTTNYELIYPSEDFNYELMEDYFLKAKQAYNEFNLGARESAKAAAAKEAKDALQNATKPG